MDVNMPDGTLIQNVPDNISKADLLIKLHKNGHDISGYIDKPLTNDFKGTLQQELADHPVEANLASAGTALSDLYQGTKQTFGYGDKQAIENNNTIKEAHPLSAIAGNVGLYAAGGALAPALNTVKGATIAGGVMGGLAPTTNDNVALGKLENAGMGLATSFAGAKLGKYIGDNLANAKQAKALLQSQNATKDASLAAAQDAGYTVPRSLYDPSFMTNRLESIAGKAATKQQAASANQGITNNLARQALGLPEDAPLGIIAIDQVRKAAYKPYQEVASISPQAASDLEALKQARAEATGWFNAYNRSARPDDLAKAKDLLNTANQLETSIENHAVSAGKSNLLPDLVDARKTIAKTYTLERAMNKGTGDISAPVIGRLFDKGKPLSDGLEKVGQFAATFPQVSQAWASIPAAGVSKSEALASSLMAMAGSAATGNPAGLLAGGLPLLSHPARALALSKMLQSTPGYGVGPTKKLAEALLASRYSPMAIAGATVPALSQ